jgi:glycosyltransferase involved in cell wall biosynthesis
MKIGIEAQRIFRKKKHGMDIVVLELIRNLQKIDTTNEYFIFVKPDEDNQIIQETPNFKIIEIPGGPYPVWEQFLLPKAAKKLGVELLHATSNTAPIFSSIPLVLTLHDIIFMEKSIPKLVFGEGTNYQKFGNVYRKLVVPQVIRRAKKVITVSQYEFNNISNFFQIQDKTKLSTVYNGVGENFQPITDARVLAEVKKKYHLPNRFFFFLGNTDPKKNTAGVIKAYSDFIKQTKADIKLVLVDYDRNHLKKILQAIHDPQLIDHILLPGYIQNKDLPGIYSQSLLYLYPSFRESFGIPILEAMACGAPVISSNCSSMPEVAEKAAVLIDPYNPETLTKALIDLYANQDKKNELIALGFQQTKKFSWKKMAENVQAIYQQFA